MPISDRRAQIERGRKAGLQTGDLYRALENRPVSAQELVQTIVDENGYSVAIRSDGRIRYQPGTETR